MNMTSQVMCIALADQEIKILSGESSSYDWKRNGIILEVPSGVEECTFIFGHKCVTTRGHNTCE